MASAGQRFMVQVADPHWTQEALYYACVLARKGRSEIAIVKLIRVPIAGLSGLPLGVAALSAQSRIALQEYQATAEDYGVSSATHVFGYFTLTEALVEAAEYLSADVVFATLPRGLIPFWQEFQLYRLRYRFVRQQRVLVERRSILPEIADR